MKEEQEREESTGAVKEQEVDVEAEGEKGSSPKGDDEEVEDAARAGNSLERKARA